MCSSPEPSHDNAVMESDFLFIHIVIFYYFYNLTPHLCVPLGATAAAIIEKYKFTSVYEYIYRHNGKVLTQDFTLRLIAVEVNFQRLLDFVYKLNQSLYTLMPRLRWLPSPLSVAMRWWIIVNGQ